MIETLQNENCPGTTHPKVGFICLPEKPIENKLIESKYDDQIGSIERLIGWFWSWAGWDYIDNYDCVAAGWGDYAPDGTATTSKSLRETQYNLWNRCEAGNVLSKSYKFRPDICGRGMENPYFDKQSE